MEGSSLASVTEWMVFVCVCVCPPPPPILYIILVTGGAQREVGVVLFICYPALASGGGVGAGWHLLGRLMYWRLLCRVVTSWHSHKVIF